MKEYDFYPEKLVSVMKEHELVASDEEVWLTEYIRGCNNAV